MPFVKGKSGNPGGKWRPGQSGNPGGRPKSKLFREAIMRQLALRAAPGEPDKGYDDMAAALIAKVEANGDVAAFTQIADRVDGKVPTPIGGTDELPSIKGFAWVDPTADETDLAKPQTIEQLNEADDQLH